MRSFKALEEALQILQYRFCIHQWKTGTKKHALALEEALQIPP
jgi:hypothetical protein